MIKVVISGIHYPMSMMLYFIRAFQRREDVELYTVGPFTNDWIPWMGGMRVPRKYINYPDLALSPDAPQTSAKVIHGLLPWKPDLWLQVDAGWHFTDRPDAKVTALVETDPHVLKQTYGLPKSYSDVTFCMQTPYIESGEEFLPYAFDPTIHYPENLDYKQDCCLIGLQYQHRNDLVDAIRAKGYTVYYKTGEVFDEYRRAYNQSKIALNWSSMQDLPARVWEAFGMKVPLVTNNVEDIFTWFIEPNDYLSFENAEHGAEKVDWLLRNPAQAHLMAENAYKKVIKSHTWDHRVAQILETCKLI